MNVSEIKQIIRYLIIGGTTYVLYISFLYGLSEFTEFIEHISFIISFLIANIYNYLAHYYITFASKQHHLNTVRNFTLVVFAGVIGGIAITEFAKLWGENYAFWAAGAYGLAWPAVSYILLKIKVFRQTE